MNARQWSAVAVVVAVVMVGLVGWRWSLLGALLVAVGYGAGRAATKREFEDRRSIERHPWAPRGGAR